MNQLFNFFSMYRKFSSLSLIPTNRFIFSFMKGDQSVQFSSVAQLCLTLCDPMNCSTPGLLVHHQLPGVHSDSCPSSPWYHPAISTSVVPFSSCPLSLPASEHKCKSVSRSVVLTLSDLMDDSPPGSSIHRILPARILEWVAMSFSRGSSWPRGQTQVSCTAGGSCTIWDIREALT